MTITEKIETIPVEDRLMIIKCYPDGFEKVTDKDGNVTRDTTKYFKMFTELCGLIEFPASDFYIKHKIPSNILGRDGAHHNMTFGDVIIYLLSNRKVVPLKFRDKDSDPIDISGW